MHPSAIIDLDSLVWNYRFLCDKAGSAKTGAAVKANAYGLGMIPIAKSLHNAGCRFFFTAHFIESIALRETIKDATIVTLHGIKEADYKEAAAQNITPMLNNLGAIEAWQKFAHLSETKLPAFIHLDTGMNRLGLPQNEQKHLTENQNLLNGLDIKAWVSHFACADEFDNPMTTEQRDKLIKTLKSLPHAPVSLCNSSGIFWGKDYLFDITRPGLAIYGGNPTPHQPNPMRGVLELQSPIIQVKEVDAKATVGYAASYHTTHKTRIATVALGYADGYHRTMCQLNL